MTPELQRILADLVVAQVCETIAGRGAGHCIRIDELPTRLASESCRRLQDLIDRKNLARLVASSPTQPWEITPTQAVTLRNAEGDDRGSGVLVIFVPPEARLSVEDSIGASTFEVLTFPNLGERLRAAALSEVETRNPVAAEAAGAVAHELVRTAHFRCDDIRAGEYLLAVAAGDDESSVGAELGQMGLLPDRGIADVTSEDERRRRLQLNHMQMTALEDQAVPAERLRNLPIDRSTRSSRELVDALREATEDGTSDRFEIAQRLRGAADAADYSNWQLDTAADRPKRFEITGFHGDVDVSGADPIVTKADASIGVRFVCDPAPAALPSLHALRLEILGVGRDADDLFETGVSATKALPKVTSSSWKRRTAVGDTESGLEPGLYRFRLTLVGKDNSDVQQSLSALFRVGEDLEQKATVQDACLGVWDAAVAAIANGMDPALAETPSLALNEEGEFVECVVRFEGVAREWKFGQPWLLADIEGQLLSDPELRGFSIELGQALGDETYLDVGRPLPESFVAARSALFDKVRESSRASGSQPQVALSDLSRCDSEIMDYVGSWTESLRTADDDTLSALLSVDQLHVFDRGTLVAVLVAPTHPLRIAWLARCAELLREWTVQASALATEDLEREAAELCAALGDLAPLHVPSILLAEDQAVRPVDALTREWGLWIPVADADPISTTARVRRWLGLAPWRLSASGEDDLGRRARAYLEAHPYVRRLVLNVVQPGEADLILRLLAQLQKQDPKGDITFVVRLFGEAGDTSLGRAMDSFMTDPEDARAVNREIADLLTRPSSDPLTPKLAYSKHEVAELRDRPEDFPAHISVFLDFFPVQVTTRAEPPAGRSFFAGGMLVEPVQQYLAGDDIRTPRWVNAVAVSDRGVFADAYRQAQHHTARLMGGSGLDPVPALQLEVDSVSQAVIDAVHRVSDWVVVIDPVFSDEFLDRASADGRVPTYVIDMKSGNTQPGGRNVVVSSRIRREQSAPISDAAARFGLPVGPESGARLMHGLHALGAGVALRLLTDESRAKEALSLSLAAVHLETSGLLRHALLVPVDAHLDLFVEGRDRGDSASISRTDLAVFQLDPVARRIGIHLVEVKLRASVGATGAVPSDLAEDIRAQLANTETILLQRLFGAQLRRRSFSLPGVLQLRRLTVLLRRYMGRAVGHGLIPEAEAHAMSEFIESLQHGFGVGVSLHGLVFHGGNAAERVEDLDGMTMTSLGVDYIGRLLTGADRAETVVAGRGQDEYLRTVFGTITDWREVVPDVGNEPAVEPLKVSGTDAQPLEEPVLADPEPLESVPGPALSDVDLLGGTTHSDQFGIIGRNSSSRRPVAVDMRGTNVVSVFGVQGSGKSYTVGSLIEAALAPEPGLNRLPSPLGGVVFHYSGDQSYAPEFAAMRQQNPSNDGLEEYGATACALTDLVVLVPNAVLERRRAEYGSDVEVEPILLGPDELQLGDWKLLMGIAAGNQMYAKAMSVILGDLRDELTLARLRTAIQNSQLGAAQKATALQRIKFVEPHLSDSARIVDLMRPGRLLVVDLRDDLIDKGEALSLFMVLLNRFTQAQVQGRPFNKIIVFDEAHKYMDDPGLTDAITEAVREMRHKGASIVIASQNPPSVPAEIIELSTIIVAHKFTSPAWLKHMGKVSQAFTDMKGSQFADLSPGTAWVWAAGNSRYLRPQRVEMRPRLTRHGGETRWAT